MRNDRDYSKNAVTKPNLKMAARQLSGYWGSLKIFTRMKSIFLALIFLLKVDYIIASEKYTVIKVVGVILMKNTSNPIVFKTPDAKASVISSEKGRMVLTAEGVVDKQGLVKSSLIPPISNIASRSGPILSISDVQSYFSGEYLLLSQAKVMISKSIFPMNDSSFFFIRYLA